MELKFLEKYLDPLSPSMPKWFLWDFFMKGAPNLIKILLGKDARVWISETTSSHDQETSPSKPKKLKGGFFSLKHSPMTRVSIGTLEILMETIDLTRKTHKACRLSKNGRFQQRKEFTHYPRCRSMGCCNKWTRGSILVELDLLHGGLKHAHNGSILLKNYRYH